MFPVMYSIKSRCMKIPYFSSDSWNTQSVNCNNQIVMKSVSSEFIWSIMQLALLQLVSKL